METHFAILVGCSTLSCSGMAAKEGRRKTSTILSERVSRAIYHMCPVNALYHGEKRRRKRTKRKKEEGERVDFGRWLSRLHKKDGLVQLVVGSIPSSFLSIFSYTKD